MADSWQTWKASFLNEANRMHGITQRLESEADPTEWLGVLIEDIAMLKRNLVARKDEVKLKMDGVTDPKGNAEVVLQSMLDSLKSIESKITGIPKERIPFKEVEEAMGTVITLCGNLPNQ